MTATTVELRCDANPYRLFAKLKLEGGQPKMADGNLIEFACKECRDELRRTKQVKQVLHRFNIIGELVETEVVR